MWRAYSLKTVTGEVGSVFDPVGGSWGIELNKTESFSIKVRKSELVKRNRDWWAPYSGGVLFTYTGPDGVEKPVVAGPITDYGTETVDELELTCGGIRVLFEYRTVWANLAYRSMTYGDIAWALVQHGMDKPGGALPIVHGIPAQKGAYERTYEAWNLANNQIDKRLTELSEVINGPDMMFRPRWVDDEHTRIEWVFVHGVTGNTAIPQDWVPDFDTTSPNPSLGDPSIRSSGAGLRTRFWCTGAGEGEGIARAYAEDLTLVKEWTPFLEEVMSDSDQDKPEVLKTKAEGALVAAQHMVDQVTFQVDGSSRKHPVGSFFVGDTADVTLGGWLTVPDGTREMKIIKMSGDLDSPMVTLDFQEGVWE